MSNQSQSIDEATICMENALNEQVLDVRNIFQYLAHLLNDAALSMSHVPSDFPKVVSSVAVVSLGNASRIPELHDILTYLDYGQPFEYDVIEIKIPTLNPILQKEYIDFLLSELCGDDRFTRDYTVIGIRNSGNVTMYILPSELIAGKTEVQRLM